MEGALGVDGAVVAVGLLGEEAVERGGVGGAAPGPATVGEEGGDDGPFRAAVAIVHDGGGLDRDRTVVGADLLAQLAAGEHVDLGLEVRVAIWLRGRGGGEDAEGVLGQEPAVAGDEADRPGVLA